MRLQYRFVTAHFDNDESAPHSLRRHYSALMDELLRQSPAHSLPHRSTQWRPPADIHETPDTILVKLELAGVREEDLTITLYEDALVVTGRREDDPPAETEVCYHEAQIHYGPFRAEIMLPGRVRREGVEAAYANGFLRVALPKIAGSAGHSVAERGGLVKRASSGTHPLQAAGVSSRAGGVPAAGGRPDGTDLAEAREGEGETGANTGVLFASARRSKPAIAAQRGDLPDAR